MKLIENKIEICYSCKGKGEKDNEVCSICKGSGKLKVKHYKSDDGLFYIQSEPFSSYEMSLKSDLSVNKLPH